VTDSEGKTPIIVPLSKKDSTRATTPITGSWRSLDDRRDRNQNLVRFDYGIHEL
jgi:hypothetical protein